MQYPRNPDLHEYRLDFLPTDSRVILDTLSHVLARSRLFARPQPQGCIQLSALESLLVKVLLDRAPLPVPVADLVAALCQMEEGEQREWLSGAIERGDADPVVRSVRQLLLSADSKMRQVGIAMSLVLDTGYILHAASDEL